MKIETKISIIFSIIFLSIFLLGSFWFFQFYQINLSILGRLSGEMEIFIVRTMRANLFFITLVYLVLVIGFFYFYRIVILPLEALVQEVQKISKTNFKHKIEVKGEDEISALVWVINQMTEKIEKSKKQIEKEQSNVIRHAKKNELILKTMEDGVCLVDTTGRIQFMNLAGRKILGMEKEKVEGKKVSDVFKVSKGGVRLRLPGLTVMRSIKTKKTLHANKDLTFQHKKGYKIGIDLIASPLVVDTRVEGGIVVFRDVTRAREVDRMKSEFVSITSHQLRTPLTTLRWYSELFLQGNLGKLAKKQGVSLEKMHESILRMINLVNMLLNISRIESGRVRVNLAPTDLNLLINEVIGSYEKQIKDRKIKVKNVDSKKMGKVNIDPDLMREVYSNLISNAIKYTPEGGTIEISLSIKGDELVTMIKDTGYGIPSNQHAKVFSKFFRGENITSVDTEGAGLGLYFVKAIIESSNGKIWFESEKNKGATFWFTIPKSGMLQTGGDQKLATAKHT